MGDLKGKQKVIDPTLPDVRPLRQQLVSALMTGIPGFQNSMFGFAQGGQGGYAPLDPSIVEPYRQLFATNRADALGQAKEAAGNLTGSGYNNILGSSLAGSLAQENAQLAQLGLQNQQFQLQQQQAFANLLAGLSSQQGQVAYQPGFLDYAVQGAAAAAPFFFGLPGQGGMPRGPVPAPHIPQISLPQLPQGGLPAPWAMPSIGGSIAGPIALNAPWMGMPNYGPQSWNR